MKQKTEKWKKYLLKNLKWIVLLVCLIVFINIAEDVFAKEIMRADILGYNFISKYIIADSFTPIAKFITELGGAIILILLTIILFFAIKNKKIGFAIALNLIIVTSLNVILKNIVQRPRPIEYRLIDETGYSFPSGHSMVSMAFYGFLIYLIYQYIQNKKLKSSLITILSIMILTIGISRIYLGVHYTSDVIAGFAISMSYLILYTSIVRKVLSDNFKNGGRNEE